MTTPTLPPKVIEELNEVAGLVRYMHDQIDPAWLLAHHFDALKDALDMIGRATGTRPDLHVLARLHQVHELTHEDLRAIVGRGNPRPAVLALHLAGMPVRRIAELVGVQRIKATKLIEEQELQPTFLRVWDGYTDTGELQLAAVRLFHTGANYSEIGRQIGVPDWKVRRLLGYAVRAGLMRQSAIDKRTNHNKGTKPTDRLSRIKPRT